MGYILSAFILFTQAKEQCLILRPWPEVRGQVGWHLAVVLVGGVSFSSVAPFLLIPLFWVTRDYHGLTMYILDRLTVEQHMNQ